MVLGGGFLGGGSIIASSTVYGEEIKYRCSHIVRAYCLAVNAEIYKNIYTRENTMVK